MKTCEIADTPSAGVVMEVGAVFVPLMKPLSDCQQTAIRIRIVWIVDNPVETGAQVIVVAVFLTGFDSYRSAG